MSVESQRVSILNDAPERRGDYVLYWMQQSQRARHNPALEVAVAAADRLRLPVVVGFGLTEARPPANARHYAFMLEGLAETAAQLRQRGIAFVMRRGVPHLVALGLGRRAALIVCDRGYLRAQQRGRAALAAAAGRRVLLVEGDVVVPAALASQRRESAARTLRPQLQSLAAAFLRPLRARRPEVSAARLALRSDAEPEELPALLRSLRIDHSVAPVRAFRGGHSEARRRLRRFVSECLPHYRAARAQPGAAQVSTLSPYLHFGQISPVEVALAVAAAEAPRTDRDCFLEELIVRRELAVNFVNTTPDYDRYDCLPAWARDTLACHRHERRARPHCRYEQLAAAETPDRWWNAAMQELRDSGFMHNYMRMYWGKKVLEWALSPEEGYANLLRLNNTYFLDGRDPSSYANVGWVFGLHDRPWPSRPVFGSVRSMTAAGLERKCDLATYVRRVQEARR